MCFYYGRIRKVRPLNSGRRFRATLDRIGALELSMKESGGNFGLSLAPKEVFIQCSEMHILEVILIHIWFQCS